MQASAGAGSEESRQRLLEKLRRIEALFARPGTEGERAAAESARRRILELLGPHAPNDSPRDSPKDTPRASTRPRPDPVVEFRFTLRDPWSKRLLVALLDRHGIQPFQRRGQRRTTVRARLSRRFVDEVLWPEFVALDRELRRELDRATDRILERVAARPR